MFKKSLMNWLNRGREGEPYKFEDLKKIDSPIRKKYLTCFIGSILVLIATIPLTILSRNIYIFPIGVLLALLIVASGLQQIRSFIQGNIRVVVGVLYSISTDEHDGEKRKRWERKVVKIYTAEGQYIDVCVNEGFNPSEHNEITVYFNADTLRMRNDDTYLISEPISVSVTKTISPIHIEYEDE